MKRFKDLKDWELDLFLASVAPLRTHLEYLNDADQRSAILEGDTEKRNQEIEKIINGSKLTNEELAGIQRSLTKEKLKRGLKMAAGIVSISFILFLSISIFLYLRIPNVYMLIKDSKLERQLSNTPYSCNEDLFSNEQVAEFKKTKTGIARFGYIDFLSGNYDVLNYNEMEFVDEDTKEGMIEIFKDISKDDLLMQSLSASDRKVIYRFMKEKKDSFELRSFIYTVFNKIWVTNNLQVDPKEFVPVWTAPSAQEGFRYIFLVLSEKSNQDTTKKRGVCLEYNLNDISIIKNRYLEPAVESDPSIVFTYMYITKSPPDELIDRVYLLDSEYETIYNGQDSLKPWVVSKYVKPQKINEQ